MGEQGSATFETTVAATGNNTGMDLLVLSDLATFKTPWRSSLSA